MPISKERAWRVIAHLERVSLAIEDLTRDSAFTRTVGKRSSLYTDLMHSRVLVLAHLQVWRQMVKDTEKEPDNRQTPLW